MRARDIMSSPVVTVQPDTHVKDAAVLLTARGFTALPVVDKEGWLVGIVTEADLVRDRIPHDPRLRAHAGPPPRSLPSRPTVGDVMSSPVTVSGPGTDVAELVATLLNTGRRSMPIVDNGRLIGIVTRRDLVRLVGREDSAIATDVRHRLEIYGGSARWQVDVHGGIVTIGDSYDDETDRHAATVLAEAVPGVLRATVSSAKS
ncbi:MAG: HPP family protein [Labedaea sp.]